MALTNGMSKFVSVVLTLLPLLLLIPAFVLSAYSSANRDWTWRVEYDATTLAVLGTVHRGPFVSCQLPTVANATENCYSTRTPGGLCDGGPSAGPGDDQHFCQQLALGGRLLYVGDAFLGASLLLVLILTSIAVPQVLRSESGSYMQSSLGVKYSLVNRDHSRTARTVIRPANTSLHAVLVLLSRMFAGVAGLLLLVGLVVTANILVNLQYPMGDFYGTTTANVLPTVSDEEVGPWLIGSAIGLAFAGAVLAFVSMGAIGMIWESPSIGIVGAQVLEHTRQHGHHPKGHTAVFDDVEQIA